MSRSLYSKLHRLYGTPTSAREKFSFQNAQREKLQLAIDGIPNQDSTTNPKRVIIIGAGFAGLSAGYYLTNKGYDVKILEARDRIGGRVKSLRKFAEGQIIEAGAELVGSNHPLWIWLAQEFNIGFNVVTQEDMFKGQNLDIRLILKGETIGKDNAEKLYNFMNAIFSVMVSKAEEDIPDPSKPWDSPRASFWDSTPLETYLKAEVDALRLEEKMKTLLMAALEAEFAFNNTVPTSRQSMLAMLTLIKAGGGHKYWEMTEVYRCSNGNDYLAQKLKDFINQSGQRVFTNSPVTGVTIDDKDVTVTINSGTTHSADFLVLSAPPSVWYNINFHEDLNRFRPQMGNAVKYLSVLKDRYWIRQGYAPSGLSGDVGMSWEGSDNQVYTGTKQIDLSVFTGGDLAVNLANMTKDERNKKYKDELDKLIPGYGRQQPINISFEDWIHDEWTMAGYSFPNVGEVCSIIKSLNEGYKGRLFFAGEHTCMGFVGYMEGALQSGLAACNRIAGVR